MTNSSAYYNIIPKFVRIKLTKAELDIYMIIKDLAAATKNSTVYASIQYLMDEAGYTSRNYVSKILARLEKKGLFLRNLVQSNKSIHKCYEYYVIQDVTNTQLFRDLTPEEKEKYVFSVDPDMILTDEQKKLKAFLKYHYGLENITNHDVKELLETAYSNTSITPGTEILIISDIADGCLKHNPKNKFCYLKAAIKNYEKSNDRASYTPMDKPEAEQLTDEQKKLHKSCNDMNVKLSVKQVKAIMAVANLLKINTNKVISIANNSRYVKDIQDIFKYIVGSLWRTLYCKNNSKEQSYDLKEFDGFAITHSGNINGTSVPDGFNNSETSYDLKEFESFAVTFSGNTKRQN